MKTKSFTHFLSMKAILLAGLINLLVSTLTVSMLTVSTLTVTLRTGTASALSTKQIFRPSPAQLVDVAYRGHNTHSL